MISELTKTFGSKSKAQEMFLLLHDAKSVVRQGFYAHELSLVEKFCLEKKIFLVKSRFKILLEDKDDLYSNRGTRISEKSADFSGRKGMLFVYLSKKERLALLAAYDEQLSNDRELGLLLGYPDCCVDFFCKNFSNRQTNLELFPTNAYTNLSQRKKDAVLLSHFPCSSECPKSIAVAKKYLDVFEKNDEVYADELMQKLRVKHNSYLLLENSPGIRT